MLVTTRNTARIVFDFVKYFVSLFFKVDIIFKKKKISSYNIWTKESFAGDFSFAGEIYWRTEAEYSFRLSLEEHLF